jgi:hypothetical protein
MAGKYLELTKLYGQVRELHELKNKISEHGPMKPSDPVAVDYARKHDSIINESPLISFEDLYEYHQYLVGKVTSDMEATYKSKIDDIASTLNQKTEAEKSVIENLERVIEDLKSKGDFDKMKEDLRRGALNAVRDTCSASAYNILEQALDKVFSK